MDFEAFLVAQMVKHLPAVLETQVQSLGREDPLKKGMATHFSILAWEIFLGVLISLENVKFVPPEGALDLEMIVMQRVLICLVLG